MLVWTLAGTAAADVAPSDVPPCTGRRAGDRCTLPDHRAGTCRPDTCHRRFYFRGPRAGQPADEGYPCMRCFQGAPPEPPPRRGLHCATTPARDPRPGPAWAVALALVAVGARRRRRDARCPPATSRPPRTAPR